LELGLPTAVIAGNIKYRDKDLASEMGYPAGAIIVRDNEGRITNIEGKIFKEQDKGIEIKTLLEICQYVYTNNLLPEKYRKRLRTTNSLERLNEEIRRRERVIRIFPSRDSANRLIGALLLEIDNKWAGGRRYLDMAEYHEYRSCRPKPGSNIFYL